MVIVMAMTIVAMMVVLTAITKLWYGRRSGVVVFDLIFVHCLPLSISNGHAIILDR